MIEVESQFGNLMDRLETKNATIGIVGLGYVGVPLALAALDAGYKVLGFDISAERVEAINAADQVISYIGADVMRGAIDTGRFEATDDLARLREPDLSFVLATAEAIGAVVRAGQLVVLESTTWPGTTRELVQPVLERRGLMIGRQAFLAFSPEREDPGNGKFKTHTIPKVVGADDPQSRALAVKLYEQIVAKVVTVSSSAVAEATKLTENIFRSVNIALVNELKVVYSAMGIDVWEVIDAAATKPFGYLPFYPGPGLGGHCIPIDPFYLTWKAREFGMETRFVELAGQVNLAMPRLVVDRLAESLDHMTGKGLKSARILVIGVAYKRNIDDTRESPSLVLMELLEARGALCDFHDPHIPTLPMTRQHASLAGRQSHPLDAAAIEGYDAILISTDHDDVDYALLAAKANLIVDTRNVFARLGLSNSRVVKA